MSLFDKNCKLTYRLLEAGMAKTELKTKVNDASVTKFLNSVADERKRKDCFEILKMMKQVTKK